MITKALAVFAALLFAQLEVTQLSGFGVGHSAITIPFSGTGNDNIVLCTYMQGLGYTVTTGTRTVIVELANGTIIGSAARNSATPFISFETGNCGGTWNTWTVRIVVRAGSSGRIQGHGGYGGAGQLDAGCDYWGSGGGGAGDQGGGSNLNFDVPNCGLFPATNPGNPGGLTTGGTGGSGEVTNAGSAPAQGCSDGFPGGIALRATSGGPNVRLEPEAGATLEVWAGGGGGGGANSPAANGGDGGGPGLAGVTSTCLGGNPGVKYSTPGAATITEVGPGTIDDRGI